MTDPNRTPPPTDIPRLTEHLFRHESGKLVSILTGIFGPAHIQLAEDVVQEALIRAMQSWPYYGIPDNPAAWLMKTARNIALDMLRREKRFYDKQEQVHTSLTPRDTHTPAPPLLAQEIDDDQLRLMFTCCHPDIPQDAQAALALKTLCAFSPQEMASAFLTTEVAIRKRLTRARQYIRQNNIPYEIPAGGELAPRLQNVQRIIYFLFNEGYKTSSGAQLIRHELCHEAIRLARILGQHEVGNQPATHALLAMMLLHASRFPARADSQGRIIRLKDQDRSLWDRQLIQCGMHHLALATRGERVSEYHIQAGISACHSTSPDYQSTNWRRILSLYDEWLTFDDSPVIALNRAIAIANIDGPQAGIEAVHAIPNRERLNSYYLVYAVLGELQLQLNNPAQAQAELEHAAALTNSEAEKSYLEGRVALEKRGG